jgi:predicted nuclease of predicted toxin-antitoxin system
MLAQAGFEANHWSGIGLATASDAEIMAHARQHGCVVLTNDLDFSAILAVTHGEKPSVVQIRADNLNPDVIGRQVIAALKQSQGEIDSGALITIEPNRTRIRILPLDR